MIVNEIYNTILNACKKIAQKPCIKAICLYGSRVSGYARQDSDYDVLLILEDYADEIRYFYKTIDEKQLAILAVNNKALERDINKGSFGDFVAGRLFSPYIPLLNAEYLEKMEFKVKKRFAKEDLEDLVIEYEEFSRGLVIKPEYLVLTRMKKRSRSYPPLRYSYINMLQGELKQKNMHVILQGYLKALKALNNSKIIKFDGEKIIFENEYVDKVLSYKTFNKVVNMMDFSKRTLTAFLTHGRAGKVKLDVFAKELTSKLKRELKIALDKQEIEDPKKYLFLKTAEGLMHLNETSSVIKLIQNIRNKKANDIKPLASALNEVHLITLDHEKLVVKKFTNWYNLKWLMLNIAAYGTKSFSLSGKARLANEYSINRLLSENGVLVPEIIAINLKKRVLIERYIEGTSALVIIQKAFASEELSDEEKHLASEIGKIIAKIHSLDIVLGDCKPENFLISDNCIYVLDLEQGERKGDKTWDVGEFLYFSGHFASSFTGGLKEFVKRFIEGYCELGNKNVLKRAAEFRYSRVFFGWTYVPIINSIALMLKSL